MLQTQTMTTSNLLLENVIDYGVDLWIFKILFIEGKNDYQRYVECWKDISRIKLTKGQWEHIKALLERYLKNK